ncbi:ACP S-malonyltransferase [Planctomycetales bacterium ZRK34]|nr:ACP S-malonyltransferase [Planctomycetales bacterium ZRK34]
MSDQATIILCPGQGAQHVGMGKAWAEASDAARSTFEQAGEVLGFDLADVCFNGPDDKVNRTDVAQAAIYVTSIACIRALAEQGVVDCESLTAAAGLSLGEYTALHMAGVFSFEDGLKLVQQRGQFMQEAAEASDSSMVAMIGADEPQAVTLCDAARGGEVLVPANFNCPGQIVISGSSGACERALAEAEKMGVRATALTVAGAFHSPLMQPAADRMAKALNEVTFVAPKIPVLSNVTGQAHGDDVEQIKSLLVQQITGAVRWEQNVRWLLENHAGARYVEPAPGKVLMGLMRRIDRGTKVENHAEPK